MKLHEKLLCSAKINCHYHFMYQFQYVINGPEAGSHSYSNFIQIFKIKSLLEASVLKYKSIDAIILHILVLLLKRGASG